MAELSINQAEFRVVLLVISFEGFSINVAVNIDSTVEAVKADVCSFWSRLSPSLFDIYFSHDGMQRKIGSDYDLQSLVCLSLSKFIQFVNVSVMEKHLNQISAASCSRRSNSRSSCVSNDSGSSNSRSSCVSNDSGRSNCLSLCVSNDSESLESYVCGTKVAILTGEGQTFYGGAAEFRLNLLKHCFYNGYDLVLVKNERRRVTAECVNRESCGCGWRVHASKKHKLGDALVIKSFVSEHTCGAGVKHAERPVMSSKLVMHVVKDMIKDRPMMKPTEIMSYFSSQFGVDLSYYFAHKGRQLALDNIHGDVGLSFHQLEWYIKNIKETNPGSLCLLEKDPVSRKFQRLFISYAASQFGFNFCKPVLFCDATFLKGATKGMLLAANAKNGNQGIFQVALAIVSSENNDNWIWFMENLKLCFNQQRSVTFISDRNTGLLLSVAQVFPRFPHSFCYWHLERNLLSVLPKKFKDKDKLVAYFHKICHVYTQFEYEEAVAKFEAVGCASATTFLKSLPIVRWTNAHFVGRRFGETSSALAESYNSWILQERHYPITTLLDAIRIKVMTMFNNRRQASVGWKTKLCPQWEFEIEERIETGKSWVVKKSSEFIFEIFAEKRQRVDLSNMRCSCNAWQVDCFPCAHAIRCINADRKQVYDFCLDYFSVECYRNSYARAIEPVPSYGMPMSVGEVAAVLPPDVIKQPGRPRKKRIGSYRNKKRKRDTVRYKAYGRHSGKKVADPDGGSDSDGSEEDALNVDGDLDGGSDSDFSDVGDVGAATDSDDETAMLTVFSS